jgi:membrane associated rhomboid family serine protease
LFFPLYDQNPTQRTPYVTVAIIVLNVISLLYASSLSNPGQGDRQLREFVHRHGFVPARLRQLVDPQPIFVDLYPAAQMARLVLPPQQRLIKLEPSKPEIIISLFTAMFLHAGWFHLISNMWFFWLFGDNIEDRLGHLPFLCFYLLGGVAASLVHSSMMTGPALAEPVIGASGAVAVTLGAYAVFYPFASVRTLVFIFIFITFWDIPAIVVLGFWFVGQLASGLQSFRPGLGTNVAWWAHVGGFLFGAALMPLLAAMIDGHPSHWKRVNRPLPPA